MTVKTETTSCSWLSADRICDQPAKGVYHGLGGDQHVCEVHARWLYERWGIKVTPNG